MLIEIVFSVSLAAGVICSSSGGTVRTNEGYNATCDRRVTLDTCLQQLPPMLTQAQVTGLPKSKQEVDAACSAFKTGMRCVDDYGARCLSPRERLLVEDHVTGARHTFRFLCDDPKFQQEYLQHTSCYRGVSKDWDSCAGQFMSLVREEMARKNISDHARIINLCCARFGFLRCVFVTSRYKCKHDAAVFLHRIADTLAGVRVRARRCKGINEEVCTRSSGAAAPQGGGVLLILAMFIVTFAPG